MTSSKRPISILILGCLYLAVGSIGFVYHFYDIRRPYGVWIELTEFLAILSGAFILRGRNWARCLALVWVAFHVILSAFGVFRDLAVHTLLFAAIAWFLFCPRAGRYFRGAEPAG